MFFILIYLGTHFTSIADKDDQQKQVNIDPEVNKILQDEQIRQLLLDPDVVKLMKMLREEPDKAQWFDDVFVCLSKS